MAFVIFNIYKHRMHKQTNLKTDFIFPYIINEILRLSTHSFELRIHRFGDADARQCGYNRAEQDQHINIFGRDHTPRAIFQGKGSHS